MKYFDLDLELFQHCQNETEETFRVRVAESPAGSQRIKDAIKVKVPAEVPLQVARLRRRELDPREMIGLGTQLGDLLFPEGARSFLRMSLGRLKESERLRIRLRTDDYALADFPWEYAYVPRPDTPRGEERFEGFLSLDGRISIVRHEILEVAPMELAPLPEEERIRMGVLLSNPRVADLPPLDLEAEAGRITAALRSVENIDPVISSNGSLDEFERIMESRVQVFHFSGHGEFVEEMGDEIGSVEGRGQLILVGQGGESLPIATEQLARNLKQRGVRLVVLSACEGARRDRTNAWTGIAPALIREGIPAVVGMQYTIRDRSAIAFSESFYRSLLQGAPIDAAVANGRQAIANASGEMDRDWGVPVLYLNTDQAALFPVRKAVSRGYVANLALLTGLLVGIGFLFFRERHLLGTDLAGAFVGIPALLAILAFILRPVLGLLRGIQEGAEGRLQAFLDRQASTKFLVLPWMGLAPLFFVTSSVYVSYEDPEGDTAYRLDVLQAGTPVYQGLQVGPERHRDGGPRWAWGSDRWDIHVTEPPIFRDMSVRTLPFWRTIHLSVPGDLDLKDQTVLRVVPDVGFHTLIPWPGHPVQPDDRYNLILEVDGSSDTLQDMRYQTILLAGDSSVLAWRLERQKDCFGEEVMRGHLEELLGASIPIESWLAPWRDCTRWIPPLLSSADSLSKAVGSSVLEIHLSVAETGSDSAVARWRGTLPTQTDDEIQTIFLWGIDEN